MSTDPQHAALQKGIAAMIAVGLFIVSMDTAAKALAETYEPLFIVWARYAGQAVGTLAIAAPRLLSVARTARPGLQLVRGATLFVGTILFFTGLKHLPIAQVQAIAQVAPLAIVAMAALFLAERVGPWRWGAVCVGFLGAMIVIRPETGAFGGAAILPLGGALCFAAYGVMTRLLGASDGVWTTFFYTGIVGAALATAGLPFYWQTPALGDLPLLLLVGFFGAASQGMLILALRFAPASALAPFLYLNLVWAALFGYVLFGEVPDWRTVLGAGVIVGAGFFVRWRERRRTGG